MAQEHADDTSDPSDAAQIVPSRSVISEFLPYAEVDQELVYGHFVFPSNMIEPLPAIIVIHEWWGLKDNVRAMANRLAAEGYIVLAIDLFGGKVADTASQARQLMISVVENPDLAAENIRQAYDFVDDTAGAPSIGSLGWCFGGGWSLNTAMLFPDKLDASVIYYGQVTEDEDKLRPISAPILGLFAAEDRGIRIESVRASATSPAEAQMSMMSSGTASKCMDGPSSRAQRNDTCAVIAARINRDCTVPELSSSPIQNPCVASGASCSLGIRSVASNVALPFDPSTR